METGTGRRLTPDTVVIGSGNVASEIARFLASSGRLKAVAARSVDKVNAIASRLNVRSVELFGETLPQAKFYICAVTDSAIQEVASIIPDNDAVWLHTAGSVNIDIWSRYRSHYGVLYPLQTLSVHRPVNPALIPWFTEADSPTTLKSVDDLAQSLGGYCVTHATSIERAKLHVAAVFACNFTNFILGEAYELLKMQDIDPLILKPLILHTVENAMSGQSPHLLQTGPAIRGNTEIINAHISVLPTEAAEIYKFLSDKIYTKHHPSQTIISNESHRF